MKFELIKPVYAEVCNTLFNPNCTTNPDPITATQDIIQTLFSWFMVVGVIFFIVQVILGGFKLVTSSGDAKKVEEGKNSVTYAIIGLIVVFAVFALLKLLGIAFNIDSLINLNLSLPSL